MVEVFIAFAIKLSCNFIYSGGFAQKLKLVLRSLALGFLMFMTNVKIYSKKNSSSIKVATINYFT